MNEFLIQLQAILDKETSKGNINKSIERIQNQINKLKIQAEIDSKQIFKLKKQIEKIINQPITLSNFNIDPKQLGMNGESIGQGLGENINKGLSSSLNKAKDSIKNLSKELVNQSKKSGSLSIINTDGNLKSFSNTNNAAKESSKYFKELLKDENAIIAASEKFNSENTLSSFVINIKRANGEIESLKYSLKNIGTLENPLFEFVSSGASANNSGAIRQIKAVENAFASFTQKYEQFKSVHNSKLSGLAEPLSDFESKLKGLKNGANTIDEVKNSFNLLRAAASEIDAPLKRQLDTFSSYKNAVEQGKESISGYRAELKGLSNAPKELSQELTKASKLLLQINRIESKEGTTANWSRHAKEFKDVLDSIRNKINVLKKEQANSASTQIFNVKDLDIQGKIYLQKVSNTIEKTKSALESKLRNAGYTDIEIKGTEDASGKIKSLTASVTDAAGAFKQLNFERAKIQNQGKAQFGFIQSDDVKVIGNIASSIKTAQDNLSSLKSKWQEQGILVDEFKNKADQLETSIASIGNKNELNGLKSQFANLKNEASKFLQANKIQFQVDTGGYESKIETLVSRTMQWTDSNGNARISTDALKQSLDKLNAASSEYASNKTEETQRRLIEADKELDKQIKTVTNSVRKMNAELAKDTTVSSLHNKIQTFYDNNSAAHGRWGVQLKQMLAETASGAKITTQRVREIEQSFNGVTTAARQAGKVGKSWFQSFKDSAKIFSAWTSPTMLIMKGISEVKKGISTVKELDTALVDLKKTTSMTSSQLENFYYDSNNTAKQMGVTTNEIINQASAWSRLGFSSSEAATQMAKYSSQFSSISPGMNVDEATTSLVSIMKAYDVDVNNVLDGIMSKINDIGNKFGTSNAEIAEGLKKSSAAMAAVGGSIEDNIALFTAGQEIVQDASQVGNAIRSIALRIRGYDEETEQLSDDLVDVTGKVADLTKVASNGGHGISLFTDASQTEYKSLVTYLGEISDIWDELDQKSQNELLDKLFGKNRANTICPYVQKCA